MSFIYDLADDFLSLLFPRVCYGCGNHLVRNENLICTECYVMIPRTNYHTDVDNPVARIFWGRCMVEKAAAFSFYNKDSRIANLIHNLKYKGVKEIGYDLGKLYAQSLNSSGFTSGIDTIIPIPLHRSKRRMRGFNQCESISSGISDVTGIPVDNSVILREKTMGTQTKRSRYARWCNVEGIFRVNDPERVRNKHLLLVDDVITTGSTMESCINEFLKVEGVKVSVVSLAFTSI